MLLNKDVSIAVIAELVYLNLAWVIAIALPMAVLVATLMTFGQMSADNEITAMKASGYGIHQAMLPVLLFSILISYGNFRFNNDILPDFNAKARRLYLDITLKKPTLSFNPGIFSDPELIADYRLKFDRIDNSSNWVYGVTIQDYSDKKLLRTLVAEKATLEYYKNTNQIILDLYNGQSHDVDALTMSDYKVFTFDKQRLRISVVSSELNRNTGDIRGDREKSIAMLKEDEKQLLPRIEKRKREIVAKVKSRSEDFGDMSPELEEFFYDLMPDDFSRDSFQRFYINKYQDEPLVKNINDNSGFVNVIRSDAAFIESDKKYRNALNVEIQKKYSIPAACIVFVLIGVPLGVRSRHGGLAVGGGLSILFFLLYWAFLIGGEQLSDRRFMQPWLAMWLPNIIVGCAGIWLTVSTIREATFIDFNKWYRLISLRKSIPVNEQ